MYRWGIAIAGLIVFALVATQVMVPSFAEREVEDRLTEGGGTADVTIGAVPAVRLLFSDGERFEVDARDLHLDVDEELRVFERLDGFSRVDVTIADSSAGPIALSEFELHRDGPGPYTLSASGQALASELTTFGLEQLEVPGASLLDFFLDPFTEVVDAEVPIELDVQLTSNKGQVQVVSGESEIAGFETGPLAELITSAIVVQL